MKNVLLKTAIAGALLTLLASGVANAAWVRQANQSGRIDGLQSPLTGVVYEYTVTVTNTIDALTLSTAGGFIHSVRLDFGTTDPDSITTTVATAEGIAFTDMSAVTLTDDGWVYSPDKSPQGVGKGLSYTFTGTVTVGDKFKVITDLMME